MKTRTTTRSPKKKTPPNRADRRVVKFPLAQGKVLSQVDFSTHTEDHSITLVFRDQTALRFEIVPGFIVLPEYSDWKGEEVRPLRRWKPIPSKLFQE